MALTTAQQDLLIQAASGPWCLSLFLEVGAALGARRGEVLALRWSDIEGGRMVIGRSLCQTFRFVDGPNGPVKVHDVLTFKTTKTEEIRVLTLPALTVAALDAHRTKQDEFRRLYGSDYRVDLDFDLRQP